MMETLGILNNLFNIIGKVVSCLPILHKLCKKKYLKMTHYFKKYHKHLTIYKDGTGIIINSFDIVFNTNKVEPIKRGINIEDGKKSAKFPALKKMNDVDISERFEKYGFWYISEDNIISSITEKYWYDDNVETEDLSIKNNDKELRWLLRFNSGKIVIGKPYHIVYVMSIPDMFPILDGVIDEKSINDINMIGNENYFSTSSMSISHQVENFVYTISFENGIILEQEPECCYKQLKNNDNKPLSYVRENNIIYNKYVCTLRKPTLNSVITFKWKFKGGIEK